MLNRARAFRRVFNLVIIALPVLLALAFAVHRLTAKEAGSSFRIRAGDPVPADLRLEDAQGMVGSLSGLLGGRDGLVMVMHPTCDHCHTEIGILLKVLGGIDEAHRPALVVVSVGMPPETRGVRARYPALSIHQDVSVQLLRTYALDAVPALLLVDAGGTVRDVTVGVRREEQIRARIEQHFGVSKV